MISRVFSLFCFLFALVSFSAVSTEALATYSDAMFQAEPIAGSLGAETDRIPNLQEIAPGVFRGGRPSKRDLRWLQREKGLKTIVNLENRRSPVERERKWAADLGIEYIESPMHWDREPSDEQVDAIHDLMNDPANHPIFIHCKHGQDRTGIVMALYRVFYQNWTPEAAYDEMVDIGFRRFLKALEDYYIRRSGMEERSTTLSF